MNDPNLYFPPPPKDSSTQIAMTPQEITAGNNILEELSTSDEAEEISLLADAYSQLIHAACLRLGIKPYPTDKP